MGHVIKFSDMFRKKKFKMTVKRFYVKKSNGKLRPIGAPDGASKMIYMSILMFLEKAIIFDLGNFQHGFVKERGTQSAGMKVVEYLKKGYIPYEFDLKGFFNNVNPRMVTNRISAVYGLNLGNWISKINRYTLPKGY